MISVIILTHFFVEFKKMIDLFRKKTKFLTKMTINFIFKHKK